MTTEKPEDRACAVPLVELLKSVPKNARLLIDSADGNETTSFPVGRYCHEAAAEVQRLSAPQGVDEEAMRLADAIGGWHAPARASIEDCDQAATTLRRLAAENAALRAASAPAVPQIDPAQIAASMGWRVEGTWAISDDDDYIALDDIERIAMLAASPQVAAPAPQPSLIADAARVIEWARSKPRKPAQSAFTDGPERQAAYWVEWAEDRAKSAAPRPSLDVERERRDFEVWAAKEGYSLTRLEGEKDFFFISTSDALQGWLARASLGGSNGQ